MACVYFYVVVRVVVLVFIVDLFVLDVDFFFCCDLVLFFVV
jgi:hypothetical protein